MPVNLYINKPNANAVKFLVTYRGALFITPPGLAHNVTLDFSNSVQDAAGQKMMEIVLHNRGLQHALLRNLKLYIKDDKGNTISLAGDEQLKGATGEGILAKHRRRFLIPWPKELTGRLKQIDFSFDKDAF